MAALPERVIPIKSVDKGDHETWELNASGETKRSLFNFPAPYRMLITGPPNTGKTSLIINILARANPPFERIICRHNDPQYSELARCGAIVIPTLPQPGELENAVEAVLNPPEPEEDEEEAPEVEASEESVPQGEPRLPRSVKGIEHEVKEHKEKPVKGDARRLKTVVIVDDFKIDNWSREEKANLAQLLQYGSTHRGISVIIASQRMFNIPVSLRVCADIFIIYRTSNRADIDAMASRVNLDVATLRNLIKKNCQKTYDTLCVDFTKDSPKPMRRNIVEDIIE